MTPKLSQQSARYVGNRFDGPINVARDHGRRSTRVHDHTALAGHADLVRVSCEVGSSLGTCSQSIKQLAIMS